MGWKEFWLRLLHDYKPVIGAFLFGLHLKQPRWVKFLNHKNTDKEEG